jgi:hypothetical protein
MDRQDLRCLWEQRGLFFLDMPLDVVPQRVESGLKRRIVVNLLQSFNEFLDLLMIRSASLTSCFPSSSACSAKAGRTPFLPAALLEELPDLGFLTGFAMLSGHSALLSRMWSTFPNGVILPVRDAL